MLVTGEYKLNRGLLTIVIVATVATTLLIAGVVFTLLYGAERIKNEKLKGEISILKEQLKKEESAKQSLIEKNKAIVKQSNKDLSKKSKNLIDYAYVKDSGFSVKTAHDIVNSVSDFIDPKIAVGISIIESGLGSKGANLFGISVNEVGIKMSNKESLVAFEKVITKSGYYNVDVKSSINEQIRALKNYNVVNDGYFLKLARIVQELSL